MVMRWLTGKKGKGGKRRLIYGLLFLLVVAGANVLTFAFPDSVQAAPVHATSSHVPQEPPHICAPGETPETDYKCFMPNELNCVDGECFQCDITNCVSAPMPSDLPDDSKKIAQNIPLPDSDRNIMFFFTDPSVTVFHPVVKTMWWAFIGIVDALIVIAVMLQGIRIMITGSVFRYADAAQAIPNILLALVAAQFSMLIIVIFLNFNNTLSVSMYTWANTNQAFAPEKTHIVVSCKPDGTDCTNWDNDIFSIFSNFNKLDEGFIGTIKDYMFGSITNFMKLLFGFSMIGLLAQMLTRLLILNLYIVTSPVGLASWALPGRVGRPLTNSWLRGFISTVLVQFVQVMGLIVARGTLGLISQTFSQALGSSSDETLKWIIGTVLIWFVIRIPSLLGTAPMGMMVQVAQNMSRTAGAAVAHEVATVRMITSFVGAGAGMGVIAAVR